MLLVSFLPTRDNFDMRSKKRGKLWLQCLALKAGRASFLANFEQNDVFFSSSFLMVSVGKIEKFRKVMICATTHWSDRLKNCPLISRNLFKIQSDFSQKTEKNQLKRVESGWVFCWFMDVFWPVCMQVQANFLGQIPHTHTGSLACHHEDEVSMKRTRQLIISKGSVWITNAVTLRRSFFNDPGHKTAFSPCLSQILSRFPNDTFLLRALIFQQGVKKWVHFP